MPNCGQSETNFIFHAAYLLAHIHYKEDIAVCSTAYSNSITEFAWLLAILGFAQLLQNHAGAVWRLDMVTGWLRVLLVYLSFNAAIDLFKKPVLTCKSFLINIDMLILSFLFAVFTLIFCMVVSIVIQQLFGRIRRRLVETELAQIYQNIFKDDFDIQGFLRKYSGLLDGFGMQEQDLAVMRDVYAERVGESKLQQLKDGATECAICLGEFELEDLVITHPGCTHTYHWDCLVQWLKRPNYSCFCPQCKKPTMSTMLGEIREKFKQKQMHELQEIRAPAAHPQ